MTTENTEIQIPEKFTDKEGKLKTQDLLKSYLALEKKLSAPKTTEKGTMPTKAQDYKIVPKNEMITVDKEVNRRLFELGLTNEQAQGVYDLAVDIILPQLVAFGEEISADKELKELEKEFGGADQFNTIARQLSAWGEKNLDAKTFNSLSCSKDGIMTLYRMMQEKQEIPVCRDKSQPQNMDDELTLRTLMQDPKYWKDQDPALVKRIEQGFKRLYG